MKQITNKKKRISKRKAFTTIEIVVVIAIIITTFAAILGFFVLDARIVERSQMRLKAISFAEEVIEAVRNFRDNTTWASAGIGILIVGVDYHPVISGIEWDIIPGNEIINGFTRTVIFNRVSRDANDDIESNYNPINDDSNTRKVAIIVSWSDRQGPSSESLTTYITNWRE